MHGFKVGQSFAGSSVFSVVYAVFWSCAFCKLRKTFADVTQEAMTESRAPTVNRLNYWHAVAFIGSVLLCGSSCFGEPRWYAPPPQVLMPSGPELPAAVAPGERLLIAMSDPDANAHILADVFPEPNGAEWRWTGLHPRFLIRVDDAAGLTFYLRFFNHEEALRARGPVSFTVRINHKVLGSHRFDTDGDQVWRESLQDGWLGTGGAVEVSVDMDPPWRQPNGLERGVLLHSIGFERTASPSVLPDRRSEAVAPQTAFLKIAAILFAAAFSFLVSLLLGKLLLRWLRLSLYRCEELFFGFVLGAACLSTAIFLLSVLRLAYSSVFFVTGCAVIATSWKYGAMRFSPNSPPSSLPRTSALLFGGIFGVFAALYFVVALCPESSVDGTAYHVALPALYLREHHIPAITTNLLSSLSEGMEMLYLFALSFGKQSATAMVHLLFTLAAPLAIFSYAKRLGSPIAGCIGGLLFFLSPATGIVGTAAYVDVAAAVVVFAVFYLVQIWRQQQQDSILIVIGLLAGFAYAIKYTAGLAVAYAIGAVWFQLWRLRKPISRPLAMVALCAFAMMIPWIAKNTFVLHNPIAPFANGLFRNPYISISMERTHAAALSLGGLSFWQWPYDITARGAHTQGFVGPVFLLAPLALLALRTPPGRQLLCAAAVFSLPYAAAPAARFFLPALMFLATALGLVFSRWKYVGACIVVLHAILSWPQMIPQYALLFGPPGPRLEMPDWRAALRLTPESAYLQQHLYGEERVDGYGIGLLLDKQVKPGERVLSFRAFQQAYHSRQVLVAWESEAGVRLSESFRAAIESQFQPTEQHRFSLRPRAARKIRLLQVGRAAKTDQWSISEIRIFHDGAELPRQADWRLSAFPNEWDVQLALDNSPLTRWASRAPASRGMYIEVDFRRPQTIDLVTAECTPGQAGIEMDLQVEVEPGKWEDSGSRQEVSRAALPPRLRRAAAENLLRQNVQWLVVNEQDPGARDFLVRQKQWGISLAGTSERYRLYSVEPDNPRTPSASK